jgi:hypothetical protein
MSAAVTQRSAPTLFDFVKAADQAKQAGETGKLLLTANGELSFAPSGVSGFVTRLWEKFSDAVRSTNLVQQRHSQAQQAFEAFQAIVHPELHDSTQQSTAKLSKNSQATSAYDSVTFNAMRQSLFDKLQANLPISKNKETDHIPESLTEAYKNVLHHDAHTLTQTQIDKNTAYASRDQRAADVVLVIGPNNDFGLIERLKKQCDEKNLKLLVIGDGVGPIPLSGMPDQLKDKTDQWTQFFVQVHGGSNQDGKLILEIAPENNDKHEESIKEASLLFSAIQGVKPLGAPEGTHPNYVTHVYSCHGGTGEKSIHSSTDPLLQNSPFILHAPSKHCILSSRSRDDMLAQIPEEAMSSLKNKSEKTTISNADLNTMFRTAHQKLINNEFFKKSDPLVSHTNEKIKIKINTETTLSKKDYKDKIEKFLMYSMASHQKNYQPYGKHVQLALDIHVSGNSHASNGNIGEAINALTELRNVSLNGKLYSDQTIIQNDQTKFNETVDMLIASLNTALKKTNNDSTSN